MNPWLFVALMAIIATAMVIAYDRLLAPRLLQRHVNKLIANVGNSDPRVLEDAKNGTISCDSEFLSLSIKNGTQKIAWRDIEEIDAYKIDLFSVDLICIAILSHSAKLGMEINEEMAGYRDALEHFSVHLPDYSQDWFAEVAFPAFAENRRTIWKRK